MVVRNPSSAETVKVSAKPYPFSIGNDDGDVVLGKNVLPIDTLPAVDLVRRFSLRRVGPPDILGTVKKRGPPASVPNQT